MVLTPTCRLVLTSRGKPLSIAATHSSSTRCGFVMPRRSQDRRLPNIPRIRERIESDIPSTARSGSNSALSRRKLCTNCWAAGSISCSVIVFSNAIKRVLSLDGHTLPEGYVQCRALALTLSCEPGLSELCKQARRSLRGTAHRQLVDFQRGLSHADRHRLSILAAGADARVHL